MISFEELEEKLGQLDETRATAERNLTMLKRFREQIEQLERDKETLLEPYADMAPDALNNLAPEERRQAYKDAEAQGHRLPASPARAKRHPDQPGRCV